MLPNVIIRNDPVTGRRIPGIVYNGLQFNEVVIHWDNGSTSYLKQILSEPSNNIHNWPIPPDYDIVELEYNEEWLLFKFHKQFGEGRRAGMDQAISSFSISSRDIHKIDWLGQGLANDYTI